MGSNPGAATRGAEMNAKGGGGRGREEGLTRFEVRGQGVEGAVQEGKVAKSNATSAARKK